MTIALLALALIGQQAPAPAPYWIDAATRRPIGPAMAAPQWYAFPRYSPAPTFYRYDAPATYGTPYLLGPSCANGRCR